MARKLKLVNNGWQQPSTSPQIQSTNKVKVEIALPDITTLTPDLTFIVAKAEAVNQATLTHAEAEIQVAKHHRDFASAQLSELSQMPNGMRNAKSAELIDIRADLARIDSQLSKIEKYEIAEIFSDAPKTRAEKVELVVTATAAMMLSAWSIYAMHAFL